MRATSGRRGDFVVGLGANLGPREHTLERALELLQANVTLRARSNLYETVPVGPLQPNYLNAAVRVWTTLEPEALLTALLDVERSLGRIRKERWAPRTIDLDLLWGARIRVESPSLRVPHPRLKERAFALKPLVDVAPDACDPETGVAYAVLLGTLPLEGILGRKPWPSEELRSASRSLDSLRPGC